MSGRNLDLHDDRLDRLIADNPSSSFTWSDDEGWWRAVSIAWQSQHTPHHRAEDWLQVFRSGRPGRAALMAPPELSVWTRLPEAVRVYRGGSGLDASLDAHLALSWTLRPHQARWFAEYSADRYGGLTWIAEATIHRDTVLAVFLDRGESELVVDPGSGIELDRRAFVL